MQGDIGSSAEIGDIDASSPPGDEDPENLAPDPSKEGQILAECKVLIIILAGVIGRGCHHQMHAVVWDIIHLLRGFTENSIQNLRRDGILRIINRPFLRQLRVHPARIEPRSVMVLSTRGSERATRGSLLGCSTVARCHSSQASSTLPNVHTDRIDPQAFSSQWELSEWLRVPPREP